MRICIDVESNLGANSFSRFDHGAIVSVNYKGMGKWYPGRVSTLRSDGSYNIIYDDGESELRVEAQNIRSEC